MDERDRDELIRGEDQAAHRDAEDVDDTAGSDILGIGHVTPGGSEFSRKGGSGSAHQPPLDEEREHIGARDVTDGTTGGTGPDLGGAGPGARELRRGSGATGTDIGSGS